MHRKGIKNQYDRKNEETVDMKHNIRKWVALLLIMMLALCAGFAGAESAGKAEIPFRNIVINEKQVVLLVGASKDLAETKLTYSVTPEDATWQDVIWSSSREEVATVSADGTVTGVAPGKAVITAASAQPESRLKAQIQVTVQQAVTGITPEQASVRIPVKRNVTVKMAVSPDNAANKKLVWSSSDENIAKVSAQGTVTGISAGEGVIMAMADDGSGISASFKVTVYVPVSRVTMAEGTSFVLPAGLSHTFTATITPEEATDPGLVWASSDEAVAKVDENGTVTGITFGKVKITATAADGSKAAAGVTVTVNQAVESITLKNEKLYLPTAKTAVLKTTVAPENAANKKLEWSSSDESVVTVSKEGKAIGVSAGEAVITVKATDGTGIEAACRVTVGEDLYDEGYSAGLAYMESEKYYSARQAFLTSLMVDAEDMAQKCIRPWPKNGELWHNQDLRSNEVWLSFSVNQADDSMGRYFMVYTEENVLAATLFIHGSGKVTTKLPGGRYRIREAQGTEWYGTKETFGREGHYEFMVFNEFEGDDDLTDVPAGYETTITINASESTEGTGVGSEETDWDSWMDEAP